MTALENAITNSLSPWVINEQNQIGIPIEGDPEGNRAWIDLEAACGYFDPEELPRGARYTARLISAAPELADWLAYAEGLASRQLDGTETPTYIDWSILAAGARHLLGMVVGLPELPPCPRGQPTTLGGFCMDPTCPCNVVVGSPTWVERLQPGNVLADDGFVVTGTPTWDGERGRWEVPGESRGHRVYRLFTWLETVLIALPETETPA